VFLAGNALQLHSHALLSRLTPGGKRDGPVRYRIPRGGAFDLVSCPHYLAEIVIYLGLAIMEGEATVKPWCMVAWVVSRLLVHSQPLKLTKTLRSTLSVDS